MKRYWQVQRKRKNQTHGQSKNTTHFITVFLPPSTPVSDWEEVKWFFFYMMNESLNLSPLSLMEGGFESSEI